MKSLASPWLVLLFFYSAQAQVASHYAPELFHEKVSGAVCGFSADGKIIYFAREDTIEQKIFLYEAKRTGDRWGEPKLLPFSGKYSDMGGRLSPDKKMFFFTSDRPGGSSRVDDAWNIWVTQISPTGPWTDPSPLTDINSKGSECCPLPLKDGRLLFSADRDQATSWWISTWNVQTKTELTESPLNQAGTWQWPSSFNSNQSILLLNSMKRKDSKGMDDLYVSFQEKGEWTTPTNLGALVNTSAYEDGAILSPNEKWLIFCRHETASTPSQVLFVDWQSILQSIGVDKQ